MTPTEEEDINETWSSSSEDDENESNDQIDTIDSSFQTLKRAVENEHYEMLQKENMKQSEMIKQLQAELEQEQLARKSTEDELELVKYYREYESSIVEEKDLENQHLRDEYHHLQKSNLELLTQNENYQKELEQLESSIDIRSNEVQQFEQQLAQEQIDLLKSELSQKEQLYQQLSTNLIDAQRQTQTLQSQLQEKKRLYRKHHPKHRKIKTGEIGTRRKNFLSF